jgi:hypothetical protein
MMGVVRENAEIAEPRAVTDTTSPSKAVRFGVST